MSQSENERSQDGWSVWSKHVLFELKRLSDAYEKLANDFAACRTEEAKEIAWLKAKSGIFGLIGGAIPATIALLYILLKS